MAKTRAKPSMHRDNFLAYRDRFVEVLSSGYAYSLNRRAVRRHRLSHKRTGEMVIAQFPLAIYLFESI